MTDRITEYAMSLADTQRVRDVKLNQTGFFEVYTGDGSTLVAVNPDRRESDLTTMAATAIADWQDAATEPADGGPRAGIERLEAEPIELWHGLLMALVLMVLMESIVGNRLLSQKTGEWVPQ